MRLAGEACLNHYHRLSVEGEKAEEERVRSESKRRYSAGVCVAKTNGNVPANVLPINKQGHLSHTICTSHPRRNASASCMWFSSEHELPICKTLDVMDTTHVCTQYTSMHSHVHIHLQTKASNVFILGAGCK